MLGRAVARVAFPAIVRMGVGIFAHQAVTMFLGDDRSGGNARFDRVATDNRAGWPAPFRTPADRSEVAVHQHLVRLAVQLLAQRLHRQAHRQHGRAENVEPVDLVHFDHAHRPLAAALDPFFQFGAASGG